MKFSYKWLKEYLDIKVLPSKLAEILTMLGIEVENYAETADGDIVFELELTSNRPDCASIVGIAREVAAASGKKLKYPVIKLKEGKEKIRNFIDVEVEKPELCPRYAARLIKGVKVNASPEWLKTYLEKAGLRSVNNVVDVTNFVLMELGHPLHAFDYDTLHGKKLIIRPAKKGEKILNIDMIERELSPDILVIADTENPQAIAGIMGGHLSEVKELTQNVLLESAYFNKVSIRRAAKKLNMMTEASYRFERGADPEGLIFALNRTAELITRLAGGEIAQGTIDVYKNKIPERVLELRLERVNNLLGINITLIKVKDILKGLEFKVKLSQKGKIKVSVPSFRSDIEREIDLIEEIARHYGYNRIEPKLPVTTLIPLKGAITKVNVLEMKEILFDVLQKSGLQEVMNYAFTNVDYLSKNNLEGQFSGKNFVRVINPISQEQDIMRPSLLPGLLNNIVWNYNHQVEEVKIFEIGNVFASENTGTKFYENKAVAIALTEKESEKDTIGTFLDLKGIVEVIFEALGISSLKFAKGDLSMFHPQNASWIELKDKKVGYIGEINPLVTEKIGFKNRIFGAEIILDEIISEIDFNKHFKALPKFPAVRRDLSLLIPSEVTSEKIISLIKNTGGELIEQVDLFDVYEGKQIPENFRSLGYTLTYRSASKTLTDAGVNDLHQKISRQLIDNLKVKVRGG